jgi:hypothetical protein
MFEIATDAAAGVVGSATTAGTTPKANVAATNAVT